MEVLGIVDKIDTHLECNSHVKNYFHFCIVIF